MAEEILGRCGYRCDLCPGYNGNIRTDEDKQRVSDGWFKYLGFRIPPEDIGCGGCFDDNSGDPNCPIRPCVKERQLVNCAFCDDFDCDKLRTRMNFVEDHVKDLAGIPEDDYDIYIKPYRGKERLLKIRATQRNRDSRE